MSILKDIYSKEKGLVWTGCIGLILGFICMGLYLINGNEIPPEGEWTKAITFDLALGIFSLTIAGLLPYLSISQIERKVFVYSLIATFWIAYGIETIQNARGFDPRFSAAGASYDKVIGILLGVDSVFIIASLVYFMVLVFKQNNKDYPALLLAIRYACIALWIGFFSGIWMAVVGGAAGPEGEMPDQMALHFIGFHGLQTISIIGLLATYTKLSYENARKHVHVGGIAWLVLGLSLFIQAVAGYHTFDFTVYLVIALVAAVVWFYQVVTVGIRLFRMEKREV